MTDESEPTKFVEGGEEYELLANDEGTTYLLRFKTEELAVTLQGEQLAEFNKEYGLVKAQYPAYNSDQRLAQIWDQGGYSWLAAEQQEGG